MPATKRKADSVHPNTEPNNEKIERLDEPTANESVAEDGEFHPTTMTNEWLKVANKVLKSSSVAQSILESPTFVGVHVSAAGYYKKLSCFEFFVFVRSQLLYFQEVHLTR